MMYALGDRRVATSGDDYWIAPNAIVIGDVVLERNASIWWNCVVRGDNDTITIGENANVQDGCVLHADPGFPLTLGRNVSIGHMVMLHGCTIAPGTLIGIGSVILNGARVGSNCLIGANTLIPEGKTIPDSSVVMGSPGRVVREATEQDRQRILQPVESYTRRWRLFRDTLRPQERGQPR